MELKRNENWISVDRFGKWARLGNQMFQYAYLKTISAEYGYDIKLEANSSAYGHTKPQLFDAFDIPEKYISHSQLSNFIVIQEPSMLYDDTIRTQKIPNIHGNILFDGYFQSEKYFKKYEDVIRKEFIFKKNIIESGNRFMDNLKQSLQPNTEIVALHVRRTDAIYSDSPYFPTTEIYRNNAINYFRSKLKNFHILIFSDDKEWCKNNISYDGIQTTIVNGLNDLEEMYVMSICNHIVIGASTYSWWAAWLCAYNNKIIIAPDKWFSDKIYLNQPLSKQEKDIVPENWIKMSCNFIADIF